MSKLLAQGGFGCIYHPGFKPDGTPTTIKYATKLQKKTYTSDNEITIGDEIKKIKQYQKFFRVHVNHSAIHLSSIDNTLLKNCKPIKVKDDIPYIAMKLEFLENPDFFEYIFDKSKTPKQQISIVIESYMHLLKGFSYLGKKNIVQYDLKNENILYDKKQNTYLISDFGISIDMNKYNVSMLYKFFYVFAPEYYIWSFDIHVLCLLLHSFDAKITTNHIADVATKFIEGNPAFQMFSPEFKNIYFQKCLLFGSEYIDRPGEKVRDDKINKLLKGYTTWDNYALSALYLRIIANFFENRFPESLFLTKFTQLLVQNLSPDPKERLSVDDTIKSYNELLKMKYKDEKDVENSAQGSYDYNKVINESKKQTEYLRTLVEKN